MEEMWNRGGLVEVLNSGDANHIYVAHALLSEKGFFVRVENENTNIIPGLSVGVSLMVKEEDLEGALRELETAGIIPSQSDTPEELEVKMEAERRANRRKIWWLLLALIVVLGLFALYTTYISKNPL